MCVGFKVGQFLRLGTLTTHSASRKSLCSMCATGGHTYSPPSPDHVAKRVGGRFSSLEDDVDDVEDRIMVAPSPKAGRVRRAGYDGLVFQCRTRDGSTVHTTGVMAPMILRALCVC